MVKTRHARRQGGAALIIALIVIVLVSLVVVSAFNLSSSNLKSVANIQYRSEAVTVANAAIESVVSGSFLTALGQTSNPSVDLDKDGTAEYTASVAIPSCPMRVRRVALDQPTGYEVEQTSTLTGTYVADYELTSTVNDANTGAKVTVKQGVRIPLNETEYQQYVNTTTYCNPLLTLITS
jgi:hypothetical protein